MPTYLVEGTFPPALSIPIVDEAINGAREGADTNHAPGVTCVHSDVSTDSDQSGCFSDGSSPEAVRAVAVNKGSPVCSMADVRILDLYFCG